MHQWYCLSRKLNWQFCLVRVPSKRIILAVEPLTELLKAASQQSHSTSDQSPSPAWPGSLPKDSRQSQSKSYSCTWGKSQASNLAQLQRKNSSPAWPGSLNSLEPSCWPHPTSEHSLQPYPDRETSQWPHPIVNSLSHLTRKPGQWLPDIWS